jgi:hypothetical protein
MKQYLEETIVLINGNWVKAARIKLSPLDRLIMWIRRFLDR